MKYPILRTYIIVFGLVTVLSACAGSSENSATSNSNAPQQANNNSQPAAAQDNAPAASPNTGSPLAVQPIPPPTSLPAPSAQPSPATQPPAAVTAPAPGKDETAKAATAANGPAPKLIAPPKRLEFGKQAEDKTLVRAITIKNGGKANLNIESVTPS